MNKFLLFATACAATLSMSQAVAARVADTSVNALSIQEVNARAIQPDVTSRAAYREFVGTYDLDNGARLRLSRHGRQFLVEVTDQPVYEVRAISPDTFVAVTGDAELVFKQHANGIVSKVTLKQPAKF